MATVDERIQKLEQKLREAKERKAKIDARRRAAEKKKQRQDDTRKKILAGALMLQLVEESESVKRQFLERLDGFLTRDSDRALFDLPKKPAAEDGGENEGQNS